MLGHLRRQTPVEDRRLEAVLVPPPPPLAWYRATLAQGWKRQLRRMFAATGAPVERLARVRIGTVRLDELRSGVVRPLSAAQVRSLGSGGTVPAPAPAADRPAIRWTSVNRSDRDGAVSGPAPSGPVVALDGPASSGKSSVGAAAARILGYRFCDTGLLYRAVTGLALRRGVRLDDPTALVPLVAEVELAPDAEGRLARVVVDGRDVTEEVRGPAVDRSVSEVSRVPEVRQALLVRQRDLAARGPIIMAGRDIGTVVLPDADVKIFIDASAEERARRRAEERGVRRGRPRRLRSWPISDDATTSTATGRSPPCGPPPTPTTWRRTGTPSRRRSPRSSRSSAIARPGVGRGATEVTGR